MPAKPKRARKPKHKFQCPSCGNADLSKVHLQERGLYNCLGVSLRKGKLLTSYSELEGLDNAKYFLICDCGHEWQVSYNDIQFG